MPPKMSDKDQTAERERQEREVKLGQLWERYPKIIAELDSRKRVPRPLPPHARHMSTAQLNRTFCWYFLMRWEFYVALVSFVLFAAYFPWPWVADWSAVKALVAVMERIVPSIDGLPQEARHLPLAASKAQLSFYSFLWGGGFCLQADYSAPGHLAGGKQDSIYGGSNLCRNSWSLLRVRDFLLVG